MLARLTTKVIEHSGAFQRRSFSIQTGTGGGMSLATTVLREKMEAQKITASFGLGGITGTMVYMLKRGLIKKLLDAVLMSLPLNLWAKTKTTSKSVLTNTPIQAPKERRLNNSSILLF